MICSVLLKIQIIMYFNTYPWNISFLPQGRPYYEDFVLERSLLSYKFYHDLAMDMDYSAFAHGPCWEPTISQVNWMKCYKNVKWFRAKKDSNGCDNLCLNTKYRKLVDYYFCFLGVDCNVLRVRSCPGTRPKSTTLVVGQASIPDARKTPLLSQDV